MEENGSKDTDPAGGARRHGTNPAGPPAMSDVSPAGPPAMSDVSPAGGVGAAVFAAASLRVTAWAGRSLIESEIIMLQARERLAETTIRTEDAEYRLAVDRVLRRRGMRLELALLDHEVAMAGRERDLNELALQCEKRRAERLALQPPGTAGLPPGASRALGNSDPDGNSGSDLFAGTGIPGSDSGRPAAGANGRKPR